MKKLVCTVLSLICALSLLTAGAEESFPLRGGIFFGQDKDTVSALETWTPVKGFHLFEYTGELIGLPSLVTYNFGNSYGLKEKDGLKSVCYCVNTVYDENGATVYSRASSFALITLTLRMKYGEPLTDPEALSQVRMDPRIMSYMRYLAAAALQGAADFQSISAAGRRAAWVVPAGERNVVIDLQEYELVQNGENCFLTLLEYSAYTPQELQTMWEYFTANLDL